MAAALCSVIAVGLSVGLAQESKLTGAIKADGSSTVYLITEGMASQFNKLHPGVKISVAFSGTGGGFKKFANGETDISNASRAIKPAEAAKCKEAGIDFVELQVAWDGLAVIINPENTWAQKMTVEQLKKIWHPNSDTFKNAKTWKDVDPSWPDEEIKLYGAGSDSGTFDYFTEAINGKEKVIRPDYTPTEDDNVSVNGVIRNKHAIGFLGVAYFEQNKGKLAVVAVQNPKTKEFELPTPANVLAKKYAPLSRPLYIYVKTTSLKRPEVQEFVGMYMRSTEVVRKAGYVPMNALQSLKERKKLDQALQSAN
jgi:phosphate transport system substrate-binding protein